MAGFSRGRSWSPPLLLTSLLLALAAASPTHAQDGPDLGFMLSRNQLIMASLPSTGDRSDRLRGTVEVVNSPEPFMKALPDVMAGKSIPIAASLAAHEKLRGNQQPLLHDLWVKGRATLLPQAGNGDRIANWSTGADYKLNDGLLLGGFAQADSRASMALAGWSLGAYGTARVGEGLYLDFVGARGGAGTWGQGQGTNWLMTTGLTGKWTQDQWTFGPQVRLNYFAALSPELLNSDGALQEAQRRATGELVVGPSIAYKLTTANNVVFSTGLKFDTTTKLAIGGGPPPADGLRGGLEGTFNVELPTGTRWKSSFGYDGIGQESRSFNAKGTLTVPLR
jgi:hypothetical protein